MQSKLVVLLNPYQFLLNLVILMVNPCTVLEFSDLKLLINYTHAARLVVSSRAAPAAQLRCWFLDVMASNCLPYKIKSLQREMTEI